MASAPDETDSIRGVTSASLTAETQRPQRYFSSNPKFLNRHGAKNAKIHKAQHANAFTYGIAP